MADRASGRVASTTTDFSYAAPHLSFVTAVVPVKALGRAKSRLALPEHQRRQLALVFAADTLTAVTGCADVAAVLVVTADADIAALASGLGAQVVPDHTATLDAAVAAAVVAAVHDHPDGGVLDGVPLLGVLFSPDRWLLWLGVLFVLSVYHFPTGIVGRLRARSGGDA